MFAQIDRTLERAQGGLGIGLALVKKLVEMHGGTVQAHSEGAGRGSVFSVRLPLASTPVQLSDPAPSQELLPGMTKDCRVLVVDDNVDSADSLSQCLRMLGYQTCSANDGMEAVQAASRYQPHVAVLDIGLPKLSGYEAAHRIREQSGDKVLLIALSGWGQEEDRRRSKAAGFDHHLVKPVDIEALAALLASSTS